MRANISVRTGQGEAGLVLPCSQTGRFGIGLCRLYRRLGKLDGSSLRGMEYGI
jgi:hypothetical protein